MVSDLPARFDRMDQRLDGIDVRLTGHDSRFDRIDQRLDGIDVRLTGHDSRFDRIDQRLDGIDRRLDGVDGRLDGHDSRFDQLAEQIEASAAETRRHFDVVAESLVSQIQLVAEGVVTLDRKVDRIADELRGEQARLNRRLLALSARIPPKRRR